MRKAIVVAMILAAGFGLSACGKKGDIKPPPSHTSAGN